MRLNRFMIRPLVEAGLREELNAGDTTGGFLVWDDDPVQTGQIYAKGNGVACGLLFADETIKLIDPEAQIEHCVEEGAAIGPGTVLLKINRFEAGVTVFTQTSTLDDEPSWSRGTGPAPVTRPEADAYIARQVSRDPDLWVLEIEDRKGEYKINGKIV